MAESVPPNASQASPTIVRVGISTVVVGLIVFSPFLSYGVILMIKAPEQLTTALLNCALYPALVYFLSAPKVILEPNRLLYQWLAKKGDVDLPGIHHVWVTAHNVAPTLELRRKD